MVQFSRGSYGDAGRRSGKLDKQICQVCRYSKGLNSVFPEHRFYRCINMNRLPFLFVRFAVKALVKVPQKWKLPQTPENLFAEPVLP